MHAPPTACRREHGGPKGEPVCPAPREAAEAGPISFWRYLEKHNREDRLDLSRAAVPSRGGRSMGGARGARAGEAPESGGLARVYAGNPMPRLGEAVDARA